MGFVGLYDKVLIFDRFLGLLRIVGSDYICCVLTV